MSKATSSPLREFLQVSATSLAIVALTAILLRLNFASGRFNSIQSDESMQFANSLQLRKGSGNR